MSLVNLKACGLKKSIKNIEIIKNVDISMDNSQIVGLFGSNGAGKTTTFYMICGLVSPSAGDIFLDDLNITNEPLHKRAILGIGYLPQDSSVLKDLSVWENMQIAAELKGLKNIDELIEEKLNLLKIYDRKDRLAKSLSGGERRRLEIARALVLEPKFLLLDEPFAGVDPKSINDVQSIIKDLKDLNIGVLITDHNVRETLRICDKAYVLDSGSILASGSAKEIANNEIVKSKYLGKNFSL
ncbi:MULTISPECIES: LPS export ABC transporter ATP-binding protein [unclassified Campylobacter]|uniref:LPS export ABC transporter ATP-binding protein n=1 Tax=unclassified Campylobacter TaxID=2593542 RepID=UPI001BDAA24C|nr:MULTISPECIES: LPS export ABC transporter ATP-binding protein [unclassified Campylobacter]MBZ7975425.1 LPS export ABC transporter ATP-binding protein [Campylobacter sp. RM12637]MBZ7977258.1 LPS export ABC transporter ATP-binding protein [Campylobacter sp. RM12654]MBZ7979154.1 LPS export ABC transporter ATP-binding protein [Campylobacter sp. RM12642]MBZ7981770.1 LPS export ABC transporter ATP-binding protein [Campylobacter sp. RM12640]MBZ7983164.1 LPS export ABC transporter ATP-binding protei